MAETPIENTTPAETPPRDSVGGPLVRTFRADVIDLFKERSTPTMQLLTHEAAARKVARNERPALEEVGDTTNLGRIIFILALVLVFIAGIGFYALLYTKGPSVVSTEKLPPPAEAEPTLGVAHVEFKAITPENAADALAITFGQSRLPLGASRELKFFVEDPTVGMREATARELFTQGVVRALPENFLRSIAPAMRYVIYSGEKYSGVMILQSKSYAQTFAALIDWEQHLAENVLPLLDPWIAPVEIKRLKSLPFRDERFGNFDARVLHNSAGDAVLGYAFLDNVTLVITSSTDVFAVFAEGSATSTSQ